MLWFSFARRYMFSSKSHSVINIISIVSVIAVAVPTAATIILLAMFGGLNKTIERLTATTDADIEITAARGQTFDQGAIDIEQLLAIDGVADYTAYLEQNVMASTSGHRSALTIRGIDDNYTAVLPIEGHIYYGEFEALQRGDIILGSTVAARIGAHNVGSKVELYALNRKQVSSLLPTSALSHITTHLGGIAAVNAEIDASLALINLKRAQQLLNYEGKVSHIALRIEDSSNIGGVKSRIEQFVGQEFDVRTRDQKNVTMNEIMDMERFAIILIGAFIAIIATFSIVGSVVMLITDKRRDIATLRAMGARRSTINRIFIAEGLLLTTVGCGIGAIFGILFCIAQQSYGFIKIAGNMVIDSYPIYINIIDVVVVVLIVTLTGWAISRLTVIATIKKLGYRE